MLEGNQQAFDGRMHPDARLDDDRRPEYERDKARIIHSAAFRRLQGKTQVMGVGEGDFHRTRLTHSIEVAQIGERIRQILENRQASCREIKTWLPKRDMLEAVCYAHDLGHPPFGHGGERALQHCMLTSGGFEGNAQTPRILVKLEKFRKRQGINPTRRIALGVLKYPVPYDAYTETAYAKKPPKCFYKTEKDVVDWLVRPFSAGDQRLLSARDEKDKPLHRSLDASIMECADDIAYAVHDLEDVVARRFVSRDELHDQIKTTFQDAQIGGAKGVSRDAFAEELYSRGSEYRKEVIDRLVNIFITEAKIESKREFSHPLLRLNATFCTDIARNLEQLKDLTKQLVIQQAGVQQLERRGQRVIRCLYEEIVSDPEKLIPRAAWDGLDSSDTKKRRVCDYIAGMTDSYAERIYHRLFTPGTGTSRDEL